MRGCRPLLDDEITELMRSFGGSYCNRDKLLFSVGLYTGFRISELLSLRVSNIYQYGRVLDRVSVGRRSMKGKKESRSVPLHPAVVPLLETWLGELGHDGALTPDTFLFRSRNGENRPITRFRAWRILREAFEANELTGKVSTHSMRKVFANRMYEVLGHDLVKTQQALGHRSINATVAYLSFRQDEIDAAILSV